MSSMAHGDKLKHWAYSFCLIMVVNDGELVEGRRVISMVEAATTMRNHKRPSSYTIWNRQGSLAVLMEVATAAL